ncbi:hypothetical protein RJ640_003839 [Escallonia rubra]|uniref:Uncharacterized protein n=1 Tax=Escallonia rubra TaxID=112253 RepID=A0AA88S8I5_9ASTE|nr:hypothetical protein RJ640_003839 [Escallonia rubra]
MATHLGFLLLFSLLLVNAYSQSCTNYPDTASTKCNCTEGLSRSSFPPGFQFGAGSAAYQIGWQMVIMEMWPLMHTIDTRAEFEHYVDVCFSRFGDRVKNWITLNEPWTFAAYGYDSGSMAPGRCSEWMDLNCTGGDSGTEPYNVTHNLILSHLAAVRRYWRYYKPRQEGRIGITLVAQWYEPCNVSNGDAEAADRQMSFFLGWYLGPIVNGVYPDDMIEHVGERLPTFTDEQTQELQHSFDFLGVNYYTAFYVNNTPSDPTKLSYTTDSQALTSGKFPIFPFAKFKLHIFSFHLTHFVILPWLACCNDQRIAQPAGSSTWLNVYPIGLKKLLLHIRDTYGDLPMIITENGNRNDLKTWASLPDDSSVEASLNDTDRRDYISDHLCCLHQSINEDGMDVSGYVAWSLTDNLEWCQGFTQRFGLNYVNVTENNNFTRTPKLSAEWFTDFLRREPEPSISLKAGDTIDSLYSTSI